MQLIECPKKLEIWSYEMLNFVETPSFRQKPNAWLMSRALVFHSGGPWFKF